MVGRPGLECGETDRNSHLSFEPSSSSRKLNFHLEFISPSPDFPVNVYLSVVALTKLRHKLELLAHVPAVP
jgi:hypothetical protein